MGYWVADSWEARWAGWGNTGYALRRDQYQKRAQVPSSGRRPSASAEETAQGRLICTGPHCECWCYQKGSGLPHREAAEVVMEVKFSVA